MVPVQYEEKRRKIDLASANLTFYIKLQKPKRKLAGYVAARMIVIKVMPDLQYIGGLQIWTASELPKWKDQ